MGDVIIRAGGKDLSTPGDLRNAIEDNIDKRHNRIRDH
jgi:hypothetical protein